MVNAWGSERLGYSSSRSRMWGSGRGEKDNLGLVMVLINLCIRSSEEGMMV